MPIYFAMAVGGFSMVSMRAGRVLVALYALKLDAQPFTIGLLAAAFAVLPMLLSLPAGKLADRFGSRLPLLLGTVAGAIGLLIPYFVPSLAALFVAAAMIGLCLAFFSVTIQNLIGLLSNPEHRARNFGNLSLLMSSCNFLGPLLAGFSIDHSGYAIACIYIALVSLIPVLMLAFWGGSLPGGRRHAASAGSVSDMLAAPGVRRMLVTSSLLQAAQDLFYFYMPVYGRAVSLSASAIGIVLSMFAAAAFSARLIMPWVLAWLRVGAFLRYSLYLAAGSVTLLPFFENVAMLALITFVFGLGMGCGQPIITLLTFSNSVEGRSGETLGLRMAAVNLTSVVGPVMFGAVASVFGLLAVFLAGALMLASGGALVRANDGGDVRRS